MQLQYTGVSIFQGVLLTERAAESKTNSNAFSANKTTMKAQVKERIIYSAASKHGNEKTLFCILLETRTKLETFQNA